MTASTAQYVQSGQPDQGTLPDGDQQPGQTGQQPRPDQHTQQAEQWRLLHPLVLVEDAVSGVKSSVSVIIALTVILFRFDPPSWVIWAVGAGVVLCACVIAPLMGYISTRYRLTDESVEYRSGIVVRKHNIIAFSHIHAISSDQPFYYQPFSVVKLTIASAGSVEADMLLKAVPAQMQNELERLRNGHAAAQGTPVPVVTAGVTGDQVDSVPGAPQALKDSRGVRLYRASIKDILLYALTDLRFLAAFAALFGLLNNVRDVVSERIFDDAESKVRAFVSTGSSMVIILLAALVVVVLLASIVSSMVQFYGFEVWRRQDDLVIERGLLTRRKVTIPMGRIQSVGIHQSVIRRVLHLSAVTLSLSASHGKDDDGDATSISLLPVIREQAVVETLARVLPQWDIPQPEVRWTGRRLMRFMLIVPVVLTVVCTLATSAIAIITGKRIMLFWMLLPLALGLLWCFFRWMKGRNEGFQLLDEQRIIVSGARGFALFWVVTRRSRIQSVERLTTVLRQRRGVERVIMPLFVFAGEAELRFSAIREEQASQLQEWAMRIPD